jgi:hypothetical protein
MTDMNTHSTQQEILLITGTTFLSGQLCKIDDGSGNESLSDRLQLAEACWNGLLKELLPEVFDQDHGGSKSFLWQIKEGESFLELDLGDSPGKKEDFYSIDPYSFLTSEIYN